MRGMQFDVETRADGMRIYARAGHEIVGALDVENGDARENGRMNIVVIYVAPRWRCNGIEEALRERLALHAVNAPCSRVPVKDV